MLKYIADAINIDRKSERDNAVLDVVKIPSRFEFAVVYGRTKVQ